MLFNYLYSDCHGNGVADIKLFKAAIKKADRLIGRFRGVITDKEIKSTTPARLLPISNYYSKV